MTLALIGPCWMTQWPILLAIHGRCLWDHWFPHSAGEGIEFAALVFTDLTFKFSQGRNGVPHARSWRPRIFKYLECKSASCLQNEDYWRLRTRLILSKRCTVLTVRFKLPVGQSKSEAAASHASLPPCQDLTQCQLPCQLLT